MFSDFITFVPSQNVCSVPACVQPTWICSWVFLSSLVIILVAPLWLINTTEIINQNPVIHHKKSPGCQCHLTFPNQMNTVDTNFLACVNNFSHSMCALVDCKEDLSLFFWFWTGTDKKQFLFAVRVVGRVSVDHLNQNLDQRMIWAGVCDSLQTMDSITCDFSPGRVTKACLRKFWSQDQNSMILILMCSQMIEAFCKQKPLAFSGKSKLKSHKRLCNDALPHSRGRFCWWRKSEDLNFPLFSVRIRLN